MGDDERQTTGRDGPAEAARGGVLRSLAAAVMLPWLVGYGATGAWALARAARAGAAGVSRLDAGYTRMVTPGELARVGMLLLAAFAVMLACGLLLLFRRRSPAVWVPALLAAAALCGGAAWAALSGGLHPVLWALFFFGPVYAAVVALVQVLRAMSGRSIVTPRR